MRARELNIYEKCISIVGKCKKKTRKLKVGFVVKKFLSSNSTVFSRLYDVCTEMATKMKIASFTTMHRGSFKIAH